MSKIIDSAMTIEESLAGQMPDEVRHSQALLTIDYISFDKRTHTGQLVINKKVQQEVLEIFKQLYEIRFPIEKMLPIVAYNWIDENSMAANNTSAFNYRLIYGTNKPSNHSYGLAIDINPATNPYVAIDGTVFPPGATYDPGATGAIVADGHVVKLFKKYGWDWGGTWQQKDWQHFQKTDFI
ncbi:MAG: M15 family metallopeptidase [Patescibacteria group bacterium]